MTQPVPEAKEKGRSLAAVRRNTDPPCPGSSVTAIVYIIDQLCELGGAERVLLRIIRDLPRDRFSPHLVTFKIDETLGIRTLVSCPLHVIPVSRTYDLHALAAARRIRKLVRDCNIQIAHTFHETSDLWAGMIAKLSGCRILISSRRDMGFLRLAKHRIGYRWLGRYFDEVHTVSEQVRRFCIEEDRLDPHRVFTVHNGIDLSTPPADLDVHNVRARFDIDPDVRLVVSVGHVRRIKGFDVLLRSAALVHKIMPDVVFAVAGDNHEPAHRQELDAVASQLGMNGRFRFLGRVDDVSSLLRASDVFCLPSRSEGLSNALLEAMACELPCVATRVGGNSEVVADGKTGYLVATETPEALAASLLTLLHDHPVARRMGAEGRRIVEENFTTQAMINTVIDSYERLLSSHR